MKSSLVGLIHIVRGNGGRGSGDPRAGMYAHKKNVLFFHEQYAHTTQENTQEINHTSVSRFVLTLFSWVFFKFRKRVHAPYILSFRNPPGCPVVFRSSGKRCKIEGGIMNLRRVAVRWSPFASLGIKFLVLMP